MERIAPEVWSTQTVLHINGPAVARIKKVPPIQAARCLNLCAVRSVLGETSAILYSGEGPTGVAKGHINR